MRRFVITGGAGFIGSAVIRHLINDTVTQVLNLDKLTYAGNLDSLLDVDSSDRAACYIKRRKNVLFIPLTNI